MNISPLRGYTQRDFVIDYLTEKGPEGAFVAELYRAWNLQAPLIGKRPGTYAGFRTLVYKMNKDGEIERFREETCKYNYNRSYYRIR